MQRRQVLQLLAALALAPVLPRVQVYHPWVWPTWVEEGWGLYWLAKDAPVSSAFRLAKAGTRGWILGDLVFNQAGEVMGVGMGTVRPGHCGFLQVQGPVWVQMT